jgi:hypothetical protein
MQGANDLNRTRVRPPQDANDYVVRAITYHGRRHDHQVEMWSSILEKIHRRRGRERITASHIAWMAAEPDGDVARPESPHRRELRREGVGPARWLLVVIDLLDDGPPWIVTAIPESQPPRRARRRAPRRG